MQKSDKERRDLHAAKSSDEGRSVRISDNTIEFHNITSVIEQVKKELTFLSSEKISSLRSAVSIVKETDSGKQSGRLKIAAVSAQSSWDAATLGKLLDAETPQELSLRPNHTQAELQHKLREAWRA